MKEIDCMIFGPGAQQETSLGKLYFQPDQYKSLQDSKSSREVEFGEYQVKLNISDVPIDDPYSDAHKDLLLRSDVFVVTFDVASRKSLMEVTKFVKHIQTIKSTNEVAIEVVGLGLSQNRREVAEEEGRKAAIVYNAPYRELTKEDSVLVEKIFVSAVRAAIFGPKILRIENIIRDDDVAVFEKEGMNFVNAPLDEYRNTALHLAILFDSQNLFKFLLSQNADINAANINQNTPLVFAAREEDSKMINSLLKKKATVTPAVVCTALESEDTGVMKMFSSAGVCKPVRKVFKGLNDNNAKFVLDGMRKLSYENLEMLNVLLLDKNKNILMFCVNQKSVELLNFLIEKLPEHILKKLMAVSQSSDRATVVHEMAKVGFSEGYDVLKTRKIKIDELDMNEATPLFIAAKYGQLNTVKKLLSLGLDMNSRDVEGATPLFAAAESGNDAIVEELLVNDADPTIVLKSGETPLSIASRNKHLNVVKRLSTTGAKEFVKRRFEAFEGDLESIDFVLKCGADFNQLVDKGDLLLHRLTERGKEEAIDKLIAHGG